MIADGKFLVEAEEGKVVEAPSSLLGLGYMASAMYGLNPVLAPVFAWWLLDDRISPIGALGIGIALSGVVIIVQPSSSAVTDASSSGQLLVLDATVAIALGSVLLQRLSVQIKTVPLTAWAMAAGAVLLHAT